METLVRWLLGLKGETLAADAEWTPQFLGAPPLWVTLLIVIPFLFGLVFVVYRREARAVPLAARLAMGALRFLALFLVVLMIYDPIVSVERTLTRRATVAVLIDDSLSMELRDHYASEESKLKVARAAGLLDADRFLTPEENERFAGLSRMDLLKRVLDHRHEAFLDALAKSYRVRLYAFSSGLKRDVDPAAVKPEGRLTKIGEALAEVASDLKGQPVAAFVLLSDGCENDGLPAVQAAADLGRRMPPVPVHAVGVGSPEPPRDIQVQNPEAEETILLGDEWEVAVTVRQRGYDGRDVRLRLLEEDRLLRERDIILPDKEGTQREKLVFKPEKPGQYVFRIEVPVQEGEVIPDNNAVSVVLTVVDDKIRVLYVDAYPRYEYRYLKNALIRDSHMKVNVLLVAADPTFPQEKSPSPDVKPLQVFPETEKELYAFDVLILGDVSPDAESARSIFLRPDDQMRWIEDFVRVLGGGVIFLCGPHAMPLALEGTPLRALLPVTFPTGEALPRGPFPEAFRVRRTPAGRTSPILSLDSDSDRNQKLWEDPRFALPGFYWYVPGLVEKPGAIVLARHPVKPAGVPEAKRDVIFAYQYYGAGKTFLTATDDLWLWRRRYGDLWHYRFWRNVIRFVGQQRLLGERKRFQLTVDKTEYLLGEPVRVQARILDENYKPVKLQPDQEIVLERPDGTTTRILLAKKPDEEAVFEGTISLDRLGPYKVWIEQQTGGEGEKGISPVVFSVVVPRREYENPLMDRVLLQQVAQASGGTFRFLHELDAIPPLVKRPPQVIPGLPVIYRLWDSWLFFAVLLAILAAEWIYRKLHRLL